MRLVIASRKSDLARIQAYQVGKNLQQAHPTLQIEYHWRESLGDINLSDPLWKMPERGVFTEDFHRGLVAGEYDLVVHSWKDLPVEKRSQTLIAATLPREDVRDVMLFKKNSLNKKNLKILTSSPRRTYNLGRHLESLLPGELGERQVAFFPVRGNVQTRVKKLMTGEEDGLIVAKAALDRLLDPGLPEEFSETQNFLRTSLKDLLWMVLPISLNPPAAAQGALAIEIREDREDLKKLLAAINCPETFQTVEKERSLLQGWGGGCHQKIGVCVLKRPYGELICAQGQRDSGELIDLWRLQRPEKISTMTTYFPQTPQEGLWFERQALPVGSEHVVFNAHWVSKAEALPQEVALPLEHLIWTSGIKTWLRLARRGLWVSGSNESLGEKESLRIGNLEGVVRKWCKWTHDGGGDSGELPTIKTYQLLPKAKAPSLNPDVEHFFWMSGSSFVEALKSNPWLIHKSHWSGPGHTHDTLKKELHKLGGSGSLHIAFSFEEWHKRITSQKD